MKTTLLIRVMLLSFFYKDIKNWHRSTSIVMTLQNSIFQKFTKVQRPNSCIVHWPSTSVLDGFEGFVRGYELQGSLPFDMIHDSLEGFGLFASATFMDGEVDAAPGKLKHVFLDYLKSLTV